MDHEPLADSAVEPYGDLERDNSLTDYNSAIGYITNLIDQLKGSPEPPESPAGIAVDPSEVEINGARDNADCLSEAPQETNKSDTKRLSEIAPRAASRMKDHPDVINDLREAAFLATSTALQLSDCSRFARRSYLAVCFATATAFVSVVLLGMSPRPGSPGFVTALAAFVLAIVLGLLYMSSLTTLERRMAVLRKTGQ